MLSSCPRKSCRVLSIWPHILDLNHWSSTQNAEREDKRFKNVKLILSRYQVVLGKNPKCITTESKWPRQFIIKFLKIKVCFVSDKLVYDLFICWSSQSRLPSDSIVWPCTNNNCSNETKYWSLFSRTSISTTAYSKKLEHLIMSFYQGQFLKFWFCSDDSLFIITYIRLFGRGRRPHRKRVGDKSVNYVIWQKSKLRLVPDTIFATPST